MGMDPMGGMGMGGMGEDQFGVPPGHRDQMGMGEHQTGLLPFPLNPEPLTLFLQMSNSTFAGECED